MQEIQIFSNPEFGEVRTVTVGGKSWFVGKDVAEILGYSNPRDALAKRVDDEDKGVAKCDTLGGIQDLAIINESGLYSLILSSKLPTARKFKHWVTSDVLPVIRKHGMYATEELLDNPDLLISMATALKEERAEKQKLQIENTRMKPKEIFADAVAASRTSILIGDLAKLIMQNGVEIGQKRLFEWLRENGYLIKRKGTDWNMPTQKAMEMELFEVKESIAYNYDGSVRINKTTKVTGKGQVHIINKFLRKNDTKEKE